MVDYQAARHNMVESQVRPNKVTDPSVIAALSEIPRELFVPEPLRGVAYVDEDLPLGRDRYLMAPMTLARLLQLADIRDKDVVLDIGCGTGYSTALLARMGDTVVGVEQDAELAATATSLLAELGIDNAAVIDSPLAKGYAKQAPYDVMLFGGAIAQVPDNLAKQLADGGRIVAVIDEGRPVRRGTVFTKLGGVLSGRPVFDTATPLLPGFAAKSEFVF